MWADLHSMVATMTVKQDGTIGADVMKAIEDCGARGASLALIRIRVSGHAESVLQAVGALLKHRKIVLRGEKYFLANDAAPVAATAPAPAVEPQGEQPSEPLQPEPPAAQPEPPAAAAAKETDVPRMEKCGVCGEQLPKDSFRSNAAKLENGLRPCKPCQKGRGKTAAQPAPGEAAPRVRDTAELAERYAKPAGGGMQVKIALFEITLDNGESFHVSRSQAQDLITLLQRTLVA